MCGSKKYLLRVAAILGGLFFSSVDSSAQYSFPSSRPAAPLPMVVQAPNVPSPAQAMRAAWSGAGEKGSGVFNGLFMPKGRAPIQRVSFNSAASNAAQCTSCSGPAASCDCSGGGIFGDVVGGTSSPLGGYSSAAIACGSCGGLGCGGGCDVGGCGPRLRLYGEYLYLRARNAEVPYAVPIDGAIAPVLGNGIQIGPTAIADMDYDAGFRVGFNVALNDGAQIGARYTNFDSSTADEAFIQPPDVLRSLLTHPLGDNVAVDALRAAAGYDIGFELVDLSYQAHWTCTKRMTLDYILGVRYGELGQEFRGQFETTGITTVATDVDFYGTGPRIGLDLQRTLGQMGLFLYSRGDATFLAGKSRARYTQSDSFAGTIVDTSWESGRIVTQLDFELGFGWSPAACARVSAGYLVSSWFNAVGTDEYIQSVRRNQYGGLGDGITFDGLVVHCELRF